MMRKKSGLTAIFVVLTMCFLPLFAHAASISVKTYDEFGSGYDIASIATKAIQSNGHTVVSDGSEQYVATFSLMSVTRKKNSTTVIAFLFIPLAPIDKTTEAVGKLTITDKSGKAVFTGDKTIRSNHSVSWVFGLVPNTQSHKMKAVTKCFSQLVKDAADKLGAEKEKK